MIKVRRALLSVSDKREIVELAKGLRKFGVEIISTGGTAETLRKAKIEVKEVSEVTGFPEILSGRLKTLHPKIFAGLLAIRGNKRHLKDIKKERIGLIDLVAVNLYPFEKTACSGKSFEQVIENIDIGGPSLLRAAAKNYQDVVVLSNPDKYGLILKEMEENDGQIKEETAYRLACEVFIETSFYDGIIHSYLKGEMSLRTMFLAGHCEPQRGVAISKLLEDFPEKKTLLLEKRGDLRYGENPHQKASIYREKYLGERKGELISARQIQGKELSFNNFLDLDASLSIVKEFKEPAAVIIKHSNPTGVAIGKDVTTAYKKAYKTDPVSAFGSVVALNRKVDKSFAKEVSSRFVEAIIAPGFDKDALKIFSKKKNLRLLQLKTQPLIKSGAKLKTAIYDYRRISGGFLIQELNGKVLEKKLKVVTEIKPGKREIADMKFAWVVAKHVKSNAIVLVKNRSTIGVGAGQMSRVDSCEIAIRKAEKSKLNIKGAVAASDAFFPFPDGVDLLAKKGVKAIIQPGGSIRDKEVISAANRHKIAMLFTGIRHFKH